MGRIKQAFKRFSRRFRGAVEYSDPVLDIELRERAFQAARRDRLERKKRDPVKRLGRPDGPCSVMDYDRAVTEWLRGGRRGVRPKRQDPGDRVKWLREVGG